jgi:hypothetical protein
MPSPKSSRKSTKNCGRKLSVKAHKVKSYHRKSPSGRKVAVKSHKVKSYCRKSPKSSRK